MKSMNLFDRKGESSETLFGDNKSKATTKPKKKTYTEDFKREAVKLASKIGVTKAAENLGVSTSSIYSWQKTLAKSPAPIQDEEGNLTFELEGKTYSLNVNSEEERESIKAEVNANSLAKYDWFKEKTGEKHWVLYNTEMYGIDFYDKNSLYYRKDSDLAPIVPINATSCYFMFYYCVTLAQLNLSNFDTSNIITMYGMFDGCKNLTSLDLSNFDTSRVTKMNYMFCNCSKLTQLDLSSFDTSKVTKMSGMFFGCSSLTQLDISGFITSNVVNMSGMFSGCSSFTQLDLSNFDTSKVTCMVVMFSGCSSLTQLDLSNFDISKITCMNFMFYCCKALTKLDLSNFDTSKVTEMIDMFGGCHRLSQLDISSFDVSNITRITKMFEYCVRLTTIRVSDKWNTNSVKDSEDMFKECRYLPNFNPEKIDIEMAKPKTEGGYLTLKK